jgi:EAL and modified HD-GYP domain-containing signal transduction protein
MLAATLNGHQGSAFIVGLLSLLDVLLELPMDKILSRLQLSDDVRSALLDRGGPLAVPLALVETYERADWDAAQRLAESKSLPSEELPSLYVDALHWASERLSTASL